MPKVIDSCITSKLSCGHVCKMFGRQWTKEAKIAIFKYSTPAIPLEYLHKPYTARNYVRWATFLSLTVYAMQIFEQFCPKAGDANPLHAEPETDFNAKWPFKVIQGHLFRYRWRATNGLHIINLTFDVKVRNIQRAKRAKIAIFDYATLIWRPSPANSSEYPHKTYLARN